MTVDSFRFLSPLITRYYKLAQVKSDGPIPWTPLSKPLESCRFALATSGGLYHREHEPPFDLEGEKRQPTWGDPSFRRLPVDMHPTEVGVSHWHLKPDDILADMDILLPVHRFQELVSEGRIGGLAPSAYSFMGYQGFPADLSGWKDTYGPQVAQEMRAQDVDCVFLTTA